MVAPKFTHDCNTCRFLGRAAGYDLYICRHPSITTLPSLLARYGSEGHEYASLTVNQRDISDLKLRIGGLGDDEAIVLTMFNKMPSLLLNHWRKESADGQ